MLCAKMGARRRVIWVLQDPRAGTSAQAIGIAERIGLPFRCIKMAWTWKAHMAALIPHGSLIGVTPDFPLELPPGEPGVQPTESDYDNGAASASGSLAATRSGPRRRLGPGSTRRDRPAGVARPSLPDPT